MKEHAMFGKAPTREEIALDALIDSVYADLSGFTSETREFDAASSQLCRLLKQRAEMRPPRVSPDVAVTVGANIVGILAILAYEHAHVVTSKAMQFVMKLR